LASMWSGTTSSSLSRPRNIATIPLNDMAGKPGESGEA